MNLSCNFSAFIVTFTLLTLQTECTVIQLIRNNVVGPAVNYQTFSWPTDPDAGLRRRKEYEALNGRYGYKHVERLGLGEDGRMEGRQFQQRLRDEIGALSYEPSANVDSKYR